MSRWGVPRRAVFRRRLFRRHQTGQSLMETVILLPLYLLIAFSLLQVGDIAAALILVNYGAASVARKVVRDNRPLNSNTVQLNSYMPQLRNNLFLPGMQLKQLVGCVNGDGALTVTGDLTVAATAEVSMFPLVGQVAQAFGSHSGPADDGCSETSYSPIGLSPSGNLFVVRGRATVRLNYRAPG